MRRGFTLIELLVAVVIISVLVGLLALAIGPARVRAKEAAVSVEINSMSTAIATFKATYGIEPPSRITIYEAAAGWTGEPDSQSLIRRMWPAFDFSDKDRNGDSDMTDSITLTGSECLVFFLGGVLSGSGAPIGFSTNDADPFVSTGSRTVPLFEFNKARLVTETRGGFTVATYVDSISGASGTPKAYLYFSSYEGTGYKAVDLTGSGIANGYLTAAGGPPHKATTHQIISAGLDGDYGSGGVYDPSQNNAGLSAAGDYDNITNITPGRLKP